MCIGMIGSTMVLFFSAKLVDMVDLVNQKNVPYIYRSLIDTSIQKYILVNFRQPV